MNRCPTCDRVMVALFQVPRCESCELGSRGPYAWAMLRVAWLQREGYTIAAVFEKRDVAEAFLATRKILVPACVVRVRLLRPREITWSPLSPERFDSDVLAGANALDAPVIARENMDHLFPAHTHLFIAEEL